MTTTANNSINITKQAFDLAKANGQADGLSFAAWRAQQKQLAADTGSTVSTLALDESGNEIPGTGQSTVTTPSATSNKDLTDSFKKLTKQATTTVDDAIKQVQAAKTSVAAASTVSKSKLAEHIFAEELAKQQESGVLMVRKDVIARFINEAGLTNKGAGTYYQNLRSKFGLVNSRN